MMTFEEIAKMRVELAVREDLERLFKDAGGGSWSSLRDLKFSEVIERLAPNGLSIVFDKQRVDLLSKAGTAMTVSEVIAFLNLIEEKRTTKDIAQD